MTKTIFYIVVVSVVTSVVMTATCILLSPDGQCQQRSSRML